MRGLVIQRKSTACYGVKEHNIHGVSMNNTATSIKPEYISLRMQMLSSDCVWLPCIVLLRHTEEVGASVLMSYQANNNRTRNRNGEQPDFIGNQACVRY